ncbi:MAG: hypothetical protein FRX48_01400 [Lasallia pustulata]|uniref:F-box domain-containing protein n=1 Tax=Lasallia pustulata TaxID=136370 RepID=A0A5M8Q071_9LECA|nr:MAG: hypothetical protein FRX48_01400 [Lasallia pustulata]
MSDPFSKLPPELILQIMHSLLNLTSLNHLIHASSAAATIFNHFYAEITEAVIASSLSLPMQRLVRTIITVRTDSSIGKPLTSPEALGEFLDSYISDKALTCLSTTNTSLSVVRTVLDLSSDIVCLTQSFFEKHLNRVNAINPSHLLNPDFRHSFSPFQDHPEGYTYQPAKCGAPSWTEMYRVYRALWRIQLYYDLSPFIIRCFSDGNDLSPSSIGCFSDGDGLHHLWDRLLGSRLLAWEVDEIDCVLDHLREIRLSNNYSCESQHSQLRLPIIKRTTTTPFWLAQEPSGNNDITFSWGKDPDFVNYPSVGYIFFHIICLYNPSSTLKESSFQPFRRLGFGIWDSRKMTGLEMLSLPANGTGEVDNGMSLEDLFYTWKSVESGFTPYATPSILHPSNSSHSP